MKKIASYSILLMMVFFFSKSVFAQPADTLIAGAVFKRAKNIKPESHQYFLFMEMPDSKVKFVALETRIVEESVINGKKAGSFIQKYQSNLGVSYDTTFFEFGTLIPIAYRTDIATEGYKESVDFYTDRITNKVIYKDSVNYYEKMVSTGYYNAPMTDYLYSMLPLKSGYSVKFKQINTGKRYFELGTRITVTGSEKLQMADGKLLDCWVLEEDNGFSKSTMWYTKKDQAFIKRKFGNKTKGVFWKIRMY